MLGADKEFPPNDSRKMKSRGDSDEELFKSFAKKAAKSIKLSKASSEV